MSRSLRLGCGEWGFRNLPMEDHFRIAQQFGFRTLEFGIGGGQTGRLPANMTDRDVAAFVELGKRYGIATPFCCIENDFTLPDPARHRKGLDEVLDQMRWAAKCGATHVRLFAGFTPLSAMTEPLWQQLIASLNAALDVAKAAGLAIAIETHGAITHLPDGSLAHSPTVTTDRDALARLIREVPGVGINYDPGNVKAAHPDDTRYALDVVNARVNYCHLKDWKRVGAGWEACAPGDDDLDYGPVLRGLAYDGIVLIEYEPLHDTIDGIERSLRYLRGLGEVTLL